MLDFSKLKKENNFDKIIKPEEIFMSLPNKADKYQYPRNVQAEILSKWFESRDEKDTIIKNALGAEYYQNVTLYAKWDKIGGEEKLIVADKDKNLQTFKQFMDTYGGF